MGTMTCTATYNVNSSDWSYTGTQKVGGNRFSTKGSGTTTLSFTVSINPASGNTISLAPSGTGNGNMLIFCGYGDSTPSFISNVTRGSGTTFSFDDNDPSGNTGEYSFQIGVYVNSSTTITYSPDPILINRDASGGFCFRIRKSRALEGDLETVEIPLSIEAA